MQKAGLKHNWDIGLNDELKESAAVLCSNLKFDTWKFIMFNRDKRYGYILCSPELDLRLLDSRGNKVFFDKAMNPCLGRVVSENKIVYHRDGPDGKDTTCHNPITKDVRAELYLPLTSGLKREEVIACLYLAAATPPKQDPRDLLPGKNLSAQLSTLRKIADTVHLEYIANRRLLNLIHIFTELIAARDPYMRKHPYNVAYLSHSIGVRLGLPASQLYRLYMAAMLHDIGKLYLPPSILSKKGRFTDIEAQEMKRHPVHSHSMVKDLVYGIYNLAGIEDYVLHHHERYDGTGYPRGLEGQDIPLESRIIAVADAVDAMASERSYKQTKPLEYIINELIINAGKQFDPKIAQIMITGLVKRRAKREHLLKQPVTVGTVEMLSEDKSCQLQGTLIKTEFAYRFKINHTDCRCDQCECRLEDIIKSTFYTEDNGTIYEYDAAILFKGRTELYLSKLTPKLSPDCFSLFWPLNGIAVFTDSKSTLVTINRLGGNSLELHISREHFGKKRTPDNIHTVTIKFEDEEITVAGKVTRMIKMGQDLWCSFAYLNIPESTRDRIFKQMFRREVSHLPTNYLGALKPSDSE